MAMVDVSNRLIEGGRDASILEEHGPFFNVYDVLYIGRCLRTKMQPNSSPSNASRTTLLLAVTVVALAALMTLPTGAYFAPRAGTPSATTVQSGGAPIGTLFHVNVPKSSAYDWPEPHQTPLLTAYAPHSSLSSLNASKLGVAWATNIYGGALDSPVVAYDPMLGETLAYIGTEAGNVLAINVATGQIVWGIWLGSPIRASPLENNGSLYVGTDTTATFYKLNATTGTIDCSLVNSDPFESIPTIATPRGGVQTIFFGSLDEGATAAPFLAINAGNCSLEWKFSAYNRTAGSWNSASYAVTKSGLPLVLFGTDNPDSSVYALNALTGTLVWRFQCYNPGVSDFDVASGAAISPPGKNGFAQGVVYVVNKAARAYALDLNNGTLIWETNFDALAGNITGVSRSTPALDGTNVIFGFAEGLFDLNYSTGAAIWQYTDPTHTESISSPAIAGGHGHGIVVTGDVGGDLDVVSVVGGKQLYTYPTGGYMTASPAILNGNILIATAGGFLYDFAVGGDNNAVLPTTTVGSPAQGSAVANPNGNLAVSGTASGPTTIGAVDVAIQSDGVGGPWWDASTASWSPGPVDNLAKLGSSHALSTTWSLSFPVAAAGGTFQVFANAVVSAGQTDLVGAAASFAVNYSTVGPRLTASAAYVPPAGSLTLTGGGFGPSESVKISLHGKVLATVTSSPSGALPTTSVTAPPSSSFGLTSFVAVGQTSGLTSSAPVTIANNWDQTGYSPSQNPYEPNDPTLNYVINAGQTDWVQLAWHFDTGIAMNASPAVVQGIAYVGDTAGNLYALQIHDGGLLWTYTLASGAAIDGSPAVDLARGLVFIGAHDGTVSAVYLSNGTLAWTRSIGSPVSAPIFSGGILYVTANSGTVDALKESTGAVSWSTTLAANITAAPTLNSSAKLLVVGASNGDLVALNSSSGAKSWTYVTGGAITASATSYGGSVYVGSSDGKVYALNQLTGAFQWSYVTGAAVQDTGAISNQHTAGNLQLMIGSNNGFLYALQLSNGARLFSNDVGGPVRGVGAMDGIVVLETSTGSITAARTDGNDTVWHYQTRAGLASDPVLIDGTIFVAASDGNLYAFTVNAHPPM
jgi:outer membrane protein assembly factor BamB